MTLLQNTAESGLGAGTAVTAGNSGGAAGNAWSSVTGTVTFDATAAMRGTRGYRFAPAASASAYVAWTSVSGGTNHFAARFKVKVPALPGTNAQPLAYFFNGSSGLFVLQLDTTGSGSHLFFTSDVAGGARQGSATTASLVAGRAYMVEVYGNNGTSSVLHLRLYEDDGVTAIPGGSLDVVSPSIGTSVINTVRFGRPASIGSAFTVYMDDLAFQTGSSTPIGPTTLPVTVAGATATATASAPAGEPSVGVGVAGVTALVIVTAEPIVPVIVEGATAHVTVTAPVGTPVWPHLAMTVTPEPDNEPPRVRISIADTRTSPAATIVITRTNPGGRSYTVRTNDDGPLALSGGVATIWDYEAPFGQDVTYSTDVAGGPTATVTLDVDDVWFIHLGVPSKSVRVPKVVSQDEDNRAANRGLFEVLERGDPIPVTSGARSTPAGVLGVRTNTDAERRALGALLDDSSVVLLNVPVDKDWGVDTAYISIGDTAPKRIVRYGRYPAREWPLPYQVVARPAGGTQAGITWDSGPKTDYATWDEAKAAVSTWSDLVAPTT